MLYETKGHPDLIIFHTHNALGLFQRLQVLGTSKHMLQNFLIAVNVATFFILDIVLSTRF